MTLAADPRERVDDGTMLRLLAAEGPHPDYADKLALFGQFVGSWDLDVFAYPPDGGRREQSGEWHFGWVLDGRTVQDVLIVRSRDAADGGGPSGGSKVSKGSTVRTYDPEMDAWWIVWQCPPDGEFGTLFARPDGDRIVLEGQWALPSYSGRRFRWSFNEITPTSFHWMGHSSSDGGETWQLREEMFARRRT
jgi:hypothetical protein